MLEDAGKAGGGEATWGLYPGGWRVLAVMSFRSAFVKIGVDSVGQNGQE